MIESLKNLHFHLTAQALVFLILGLIMLFSPLSVTAFLVSMVAVFVFVMGIFVLTGGLMSGSTFGSLMGGFLILLALWSFINPNSVAAFLPAIFGVLMLYHGIADLQLAMESRRYQSKRWPMMLLAGVVSMIFGLVCIFGAFGILSLVTRVIGIMIILDAIGDMILVHETNQASKDYIDVDVVSEEDVTD